MLSMARQVARYMLLLTVSSLGLSGCVTGLLDEAVDTDDFAPNRRGEVRNNSHIATDIIGTWRARVPRVLQRKLAIITAGIEDGEADRFDPPLSNAERIWFHRAADPESAYLAWYRCATECRFELRESSMWNHGYAPYTAVGSGLTDVVIDGREVSFTLHQHDPSGMGGTARIRMNRDWTAFRVVAFNVESYRDRHLGQKLELFYVRDEEAE